MRKIFRLFSLPFWFTYPPMLAYDIYLISKWITENNAMCAAISGVAVGISLGMIGVYVFYKIDE